MCFKVFSSFFLRGNGEEVVIKIKRYISYFEYQSSFHTKAARIRSKVRFSLIIATGMIDGEGTNVVFWQMKC